VLDSEAVQPGTGDDVFLALQNARSATWDGIKTRAERRARLIDYVPAEVSPALVIAYEYYADARRDDEIVERNNIRHGGFVPANPIKLLSE
jgi:prophage DNA circulation protein